MTPTQTSSPSSATNCATSWAEHASAAYATFWDALRAGKSQTSEFRRLTKGGREIWIVASYKPVRIVKFASDISAQKARSLDMNGQIAALHRSQALIPFAPDGTILEANPNHLAAVRYGAQEIVGRHHGMFVAPQDQANPANQAFWTAWGRDEYQARDSRRLAKDGREILIPGTYNPIRDDEGRLDKVVKSATEVTTLVHERQRRAEQAHAIGTDPGAIGQAVRDVMSQMAVAAETVRQVSGDIQVVA